MALGRSVDIAINHDPKAIVMHKTNHRKTLHLTEDIFEVDLNKYVKGQHVALMWASPDCTSHSKAKGGQPRKSGLRILPWAVYKHASTILPDVVIMENVEEIQKWGPLDENGFPIKEREGEEYNKFINAMISLGYEFDCRELVAADYGAPTIRKRWYAIFRRDGKPIVWPEPTHNKDGADGLSKWLSCGDLVNWSNLGVSIFDRDKELAESIKNRLVAGIKKYILENPPYIVEDKRAVEYAKRYEQSAKKNSYKDGLIASFITKYYKTGIGQSLNEPLHTITPLLVILVLYQHF